MTCRASALRRFPLVELSASVIHGVWPHHNSRSTQDADQIFDDTLPVADGVLEAGARVPLQQLRDAMQDWFRRKSYLPPAAVLVVKEE